ncbi:unnamed protein product [Closterium sp. NIES-53]
MDRVTCRHPVYSSSATPYKGSKSSGEATPGPVQLSQFLGRDDGSTRYSVISGKKIRMKVDKTKDDKVAEANRSELLRFLNSSYD